MIVIVDYGLGNISNVKRAIEQGMRWLSQIPQK